MGPHKLGHRLCAVGIHRAGHRKRVWAIGFLSLLTKQVDRRLFAPLLTLNFFCTWCDVVTWSARHCWGLHFVRIVSSIASLLPMVQWKPPRSIMVRRGIINKEASRARKQNIDYAKQHLTVGCPPRWCIPQTQPSVSLGWLVQLKFLLLKNVQIYTSRVTTDIDIPCKKSHHDSCKLKII